MDEIKFSSRLVVASIDVRATRTFTEEDISDIVVGAIEGGINYWGYITPETKEGKPKEVATSEWCARLLLDGKPVHIRDVEDDEELFQLTFDKLVSGMRQNAVRNNDADLDCYDAEDYDCIFQYGLFNDIVYG